MPPVLITAYGESKTATEWARDPRCRVSRNTLKKRLADGWHVETALTTATQPGQAGLWTPLTEAQAAELRQAADTVRNGPKVHRYTPDDAPERNAIRDRNALILAAIGRRTSVSEVARATGLSGMQVTAIRDASR